MKRKTLEKEAFATQKNSLKDKKMALPMEEKEALVPNPMSFEELKQKIQKSGAKGLHIVADFDFTLTKRFEGGKRLASAIAHIREGGYLTPDYAPRAFALRDEYYPIEKNPEISVQEKSKKMLEWWQRHIELLVECGMNKKVIEDIVAKNKIVPREGLFEFLETLSKNNIPLLIFSAGAGDIIEEFLKAKKRLYKNTHIVSNFFEFNKKGFVRGYKSGIIHSFNKNEFQIKGTPYCKEVEKRKNALLLGDSISDIGMISGIKHENAIKIGFLNESIELEEFKKNFDLIITNNGSMQPINALLKEII